MKQTSSEEGNGTAACGCKQTGSEKSVTRIVLLTGFLGAGKTSVLRHLLGVPAQDGCSKTGVIVNEFGQTSIDGPILKAYSAHITELNNGSIFCQCLAGNFVDSMVAMLELGVRDLYIESTGLADPSNMQAMLSGVKKRCELPFEYAGVLCVVDAKYFHKLSQSNTVVNRQILQSTLIVLNKLDLIDAEERAAAEQAIRKLNPFARIIPTHYGRIDPENLQLLRRSRLGRNLPSLNTPSSRSKTLILRCTEPLSRAELESWLHSLIGQVFRLKGFVRLKDEKGCWQVDLVGKEIRIEAAGEDASFQELVMIPYLDLDEQRIRDSAARQLGTACHWQA